jgi:hypothetical protein
MRKNCFLVRAARGSFSNQASAFGARRESLTKEKPYKGADRGAGADEIVVAAH